MNQPSTTFNRAQLVDHQLAALDSQSTDQLRHAWQRLKRTTPPQGLSRDLMIRTLAYSIQEQAHGTMPKATLRRLSVLAGTHSSSDRPPASAAVPRPGTKLVRDWGGATHTVLVLDDGFDYGGQRYASLSKIAQIISGHHRSGPAFFGLKRRGQRFVAQPNPSADGSAE